MAVPKKRRSKSQKRIKHACWKIETPSLRPCPNCGEMGLQHIACAKCGTYKGRLVIKVKSKEDTKKEK